MKKAFSTEFVIIIAVIGLSVLSRAILDPVMPLYLTSFGTSPEILGLMLAAGMVGMVFGEVTGGLIADRVGVGIPLIIGTFGCAPIVLSFIFTTDTTFIFLIFFFWGVVRSAIFGPGRGYFGGNVPLSQKATFMALFAASMSVSRGLGSLVSGFIADTWGYSWNFYFSAIAAFLGGVVVIIGLKKLRKRQPPTDVSPASINIPAPETAGQGYGHSFILQCSIAALRFVEMGITMAFLPLLATQVAGLDATKVGVLFTVNGVVTAAALIPMGRLADRKGRKLFIVLGLLFSASSMAGIAFSKSFSWMLGFVILQGLAQAAFSPAALALLSDTVPQHRQGTAMGIYGSAEDIGTIAGSALAGFIWVAAGPQLTFLTASVTSIAGALICYAFIKERTARRLQPATFGG